jgi:allantoin racemase
MYRLGEAIATRFKFARRKNMKLAHIMPVCTTDERKQKVHTLLKSVVHEATAIDVIDFTDGPEDLEYYDDDLKAVSLMMNIKDQLDGYDAVSIACFYDPGLRELREALNIPVVGIAQASMSLANLLGHKFSVIVGRNKHIPKMEDNSLIYGFSSKIASWRSVELTVEQFKKDQALTWERALREGKKAVEEDRAEVIVLGCSALDIYAKRLHKELKVPVINPIIAGIKLCETLADLKNKTNLNVSKVYDYEAKTALVTE